MRRVALALGVLAVVVAVPTGGAAAVSPTVRLTIVHVVSGCHVWKLGRKVLGPSTKLTVARGTRLEVRPSCPMDFDVRQVAGPRIALGGSRIYAGTARTLVFRKPGTYRFVAVNVQSSEERGLPTLGPDNRLSLTVVVR